MNMNLDNKHPLTNGHEVPKSLLHSVGRQLDARLPLLELGEIYSAKLLLGSAYWAGLSNPAKRQVGMIILYFVDHDLVDLELASPRDASPLWYRLKKRVVTS